MKWTIFLGLFLLSGCLPVVPPKPAPSDAPGECAPMCANLERMGCAAGEGSPGPDEQMGTADDVGCTPTCESLLLSDPTVDLHLGCQAGAGSCEEADRCFE
jgi:hypothetical protein